VLSTFETPLNTADNYGQRLRALVVPPTTGSYVFWIASDDQSILYLSPDESPANKLPIANLNSAVSSRVFTSFTSQQSSNLGLIAGQRYYLEVLHKEGTGGDHVAVRWRLPNGTIEEPLPASRCRPFGLPATTIPIINQQPTNTTVAENFPASFRVVLTNLDLVGYQWQRDGTNIPGALGATLTLPGAALTDHGAGFRVVLTNSLGAVTSSLATLTVLADTNAPSLAAIANVDAATVQVIFNEPVEAASATNRLNYALDGGATVSNAAFAVSTRIIHLTTSPLVFGTAYTLTVNGVRDRAAAANVISSNSQQVFPALLKGIHRELFTNVGGNFLIDLTNSPAYPDHPDAAELMTNVCETASNLADSFGQRFRARVIPPVTGNYTFWLAADENATLFLGTNDSPGSARLVATSSAALVRQWDAATAQKSVPISLLAGQTYYFEALMKEGVGNDNFAVRWQWPDGSFEEPIPAIRLSPVGLNPPLVTQPPTNVIALEASAAVFTVGIGNVDPVTFQWQRNGVNLPGATNAAYTNPAVSRSDGGSSYRCLLSNAVGTTTSAVALLTVVADTVPPAVAGALNQGATNVVVFYSEPVEAASATNRLNYVLNGVTIQAAALRSDNRSVLLTVSPLTLGVTYNGTVSGVRDRAAATNLIPSGSPFSFTALEFFPQDIGAPATPGSVIAVAAGADIRAAGSDIGGTNDQFSLAFQLRTGDFDVKVRVARLDLADTWTEAGLMARENLTPSSRHVSVLATPSLAGVYLEWRTNSTVNASTAGSFPVNYPNTWLRLARVGNAFSGYASLDGQVWSQLGAVTSALPATLQLGFAVSSHSASETVAVFREFMSVTNPTLGALTFTSEPPGPSSRRTPLAITEIMYHPAERADGRSGEFVELFNSNPFPEELGGFRLSGDIDFEFPPGTVLKGGAYLVIARNLADFQAIYGVTNALGPYANNLPNTAGTVRLRNEVGAVLLEVEYDSKAPWPAAADGAGHSLVLARPSWGEGQVKAWAQSDLVGGSPGGADPVRFEPQRNVVINEFLAHTDPPDVDFIELYNHSAQPADLSGCWLSDDPATNKFRIPEGTTIGATGFVFFTEATLGFSLSSMGETIYLLNSNRTRVLDAVRFEGQENGVATGRFPDGAPAFSRLASPTPGAPNAALRADAIVINEIMYDPISGREEDEWLELFNRGAGPVGLAGWRFTDGIDFTFAPDAVIPAGGYLVVAKSVTNLLAKYPLLTAANCVGNFDGTLRNSGERIALAMPDSNLTTNNGGGVQTNVLYIVMDEVTYGAGGRWGPWSAGGGSSLELIDPRADNRLAPNWADSDETSKAPWTTVSAAGTLDNSSYTNWNSLQIILQDAGECLVDDVSVSIAGSANLVTNPGFESGLGDWFAQGNQSYSLANTGFNSSASMRLRSVGRGDTGANRIRTTLSATYSNNVTGTLSARVRWQRGWPEILLRLRGNHLEAPATPAPAAQPGNTRRAEQPRPRQRRACHHRRGPCPGVAGGESKHPRDRTRARRRWFVRGAIGLAGRSGGSNECIADARHGIGRATRSRGMACSA
jgi:hypothetical protein